MIQFLHCTNTFSQASPSILVKNINVFLKLFRYNSLGDYEGAIKNYDKAIEINPQDSAAWYNKGTCLAHLGNNKEAIGALDRAFEIDPQRTESLALKESIISNSDDLITSLKSRLSNNIFVEEDDLLEYAETYLNTYQTAIKESNLSLNDLALFPFYQGYPYAVDANISVIHGASIKFIPNSTNENQATIVSYPIEELIPKVTKNVKNSDIAIVILDRNSSNVMLNGFNIDGGYVYVNNSTNICLSKCASTVILGQGACFNGFTYIGTNELYRDGNLRLNGTLVLKDSKIIMKSNLKNDWTKEKAEEDAIDFIYTAQIGEIFDYSKLTGLGYLEIDKLFTEYNKKETSGYYETKKYEKWKDRQAIFKKADQYGIPYESVLIQYLDNKQEETRPEKVFRYLGDILTVKELAVIFIGIVGLIKRKEIWKKLKERF